MHRRFTNVAARLQQLCCRDRCLHTTASASDSFSFACAVSNHGNLYNAIRECVDRVEEHLPLKDVHFCQLLVSTKHVSTLAHAPQCLLDNLSRTLDFSEGPPTRPVIIGGALQSVCGSGMSPEAVPGVSLLAGSLPGVQLMPFHVRDASLPPFTAQQWASLLRKHTNHSSSSSVSRSGASGAPGIDSNACAAIIFSAPHFTEVESFLQRLSSALPNIPVVGGVTEKEAWIDTENEYGALFCGPEVHCSGAVGVVMQGPLVMRHILLQSGRPAGRRMTVTEAAGNVILALENRPVHDSFVVLLHSLPKADQKRELLLGITEDSIAGAGTDSCQHFVARSMHLSSTTYGRPVLAVATSCVPVGAQVQLLVRDFECNHQQQKHSLAAVAKQLPVAPSGRPSQVALFSHCCVALPHKEANVVAEVLPQVPFSGGRMQGEFAGSHCTANCPPTSAADHVSTAIGGAKLHSYAASFAVLHHVESLDP